MADLKYSKSKGSSLLSVAAIMLYAMTAVAQSAGDKEKRQRMGSITHI